MYHEPLRPVTLPAIVEEVTGSSGRGVNDKLHYYCSLVPDLVCWQHVVPVLSVVRIRNLCDTEVVVELDRKGKTEYHFDHICMKFDGKTFKLT